MGFIDKVKDFARKNPDKVDSAVQKAGDAFDARTGGKFASHTDTAQRKGGDFLKGGAAAPVQPTPGAQPPAGAQPTPGAQPPAGEQPPA